jgi:hypothetical protein
MRHKLLSSALMATVLSIGLPIVAQTSTDPGFKQDMKNAGHSTKNAAKDTGNGVKSGTKNTTKKATHKTAQKTDEGAQKVEQKTTPDQ